MGCSGPERTSLPYRMDAGTLPSKINFAVEFNPVFYSRLAIQWMVDPFLVSIHGSTGHLGDRLAMKE